jgi:hypothetical protein
MNDQLMFICSTMGGSPSFSFDSWISRIHEIGFKGEDNSNRRRCGRPGIKWRSNDMTVINSTTFELDGCWWKVLVHHNGDRVTSIEVLRWPYYRTSAKHMNNTLCAVIGNHWAALVPEAVKHVGTHVLNDVSPWSSNNGIVVYDMLLDDLCKWDGTFDGISFGRGMKEYQATYNWLLLCYSMRNMSFRDKFITWSWDDASDRTARYRDIAKHVSRASIDEAIESWQRIREPAMSGNTDYYMAKKLGFSMERPDEWHHYKALVDHHHRLMAKHGPEHGLSCKICIGTMSWHTIMDATIKRIHEAIGTDLPLYPEWERIRYHGSVQNEEVDLFSTFTEAQVRKWVRWTSQQDRWYDTVHAFVREGYPDVEVLGDKRLPNMHFRQADTIDVAAAAWKEAENVINVKQCNCTACRGFTNYILAKRIAMEINPRANTITKCAFCGSRLHAQELGREMEDLTDEAGVKFGALCCGCYSTYMAKQPAEALVVKRREE